LSLSPLKFYDFVVFVLAVDDSRPGFNVFGDFSADAVEKCGQALHSQLVEHLLAAFIDLDQAGIFENCEVLGNRRKIGLDRFDELADTLFAAGEFFDDVKAGGVGESF